MNSVITPLQEYVSNANESITNLEDAKVPDNQLDYHDNLIRSLKEYEEKLESKYIFFKENESSIVSSNSLLLEGNIFAMANSTDFSHEYDRLNAELEIVTENLKQRLKTISAHIIKL